MNGQIIPGSASNQLPWQKLVAPYQTPDLWRSWGQVANSILPYLLLWALMVWSLKISYWLTLLLAIPAAGFMIRIFILFHDCGHGSLFKSKRTNAIVGMLTGILTFSPYDRWRHDHAIHHATAGNLDRRGTGDVLTLTVEEYQALKTWKKLFHRLINHPLVLFTIGSTSVFLIGHRFSSRTAGKRERYSVYWTNLALSGILLLMSALIGFKAYLLIQLPILFLGTSVGVWLFFVQHHFEGVYWARQEHWNFVAAALQGSSFYKLPRILQWFTGNIGFHHIHHLSPRIPNYNLERCHNENPTFQQVKPLTLLSSLRCSKLHLWDENQQKLVGFSDL